MKNIQLIVVLFFGLVACTSDDELKPLSLDGCSSGILTNKVDIDNAVVGTWKLKDSKCGLCAPSSDSKGLLAVKAKFNSDNTFTVMVDNKITTSGSWSVDEQGLNTRIELIPGSVYLTDSFNMCENELLTEDLTVIDLFQNKFIKL